MHLKFNNSGSDDALVIISAHINSGKQVGTGLLSFTNKIHRDEFLRKIRESTKLEEAD